MDVRLVEFPRLTAKEIEQLAVLHHSVMHTLLTDLGLRSVWRYYQIAQQDAQTIGFCAISGSEGILGWAIGSPHPDRITSQLRSPFGWFILQMLRITWTRPIVLWQLMASLSSSRQETLEGAAVELTYIGVASGQRGRGMGSKLLRAFIEASHLQGYHRVILSVEKENLPAITLYEKAGFRIVKTFTEGRYQRHRMELALVS